jgi:peptidoglycan LD-endopeptidase LytH
MRRRSATRIAWLVGIAGVVAAAILAPDRLREVWRRLEPSSPHQRYTRALEAGGLAHTALAAEWLTAAARAVNQPVALTAPFIEAALVDPARPLALGYEITLKRGQKFDVAITVDTDTPGRVFIDLFRREGVVTVDGAVASAAEDKATLSYEARESGAYVLRVQPELLRGGHLTVRTTIAASLLFPVSGSQGIQSVFGDPRDAGRRRHEGVDIFAKAGTPVVAASDGFVSRVGENALGGQVVWVWDVSRGVRYYYAHLQQQLVSAGTLVRRGQVLGTVGNTGNARTTPPHLHFGIYASGEGAIDPEAFIRPGPPAPATPALKTAALGVWGRTRGAAILRVSPSAGARAVETVPQGAALRVEGALGPWIRTRVGDRSVGFVAARDLSLGPAATP